jgi:hypothetical protein
MLLETWRIRYSNFLSELPLPRALNALERCLITFVLYSIKSSSTRTWQGITFYLEPFVIKY